MGTLKSFLESKSITAAQIAVTSNRVELPDLESRSLLVKRAAQRRVKDTGSKKFSEKYSEHGITKPATAGRAVSEQQVKAAIEDKAISRKARAKILRAVNVILTKKNEPAADMKALFEGVAARAGKKPAVAEKK
jgi:hypothetical protein